MSDAKKIRMHLEGTDGIQNDDATDYFISGPLLIFAEVDTLTDLYSDEFKNIVIGSNFYTNRQSIIVFVKQLFNEEESEGEEDSENVEVNEEESENEEDSARADLVPMGSLKYRGSYFMYDYSQEKIIDKAPIFYGDQTTYVNTAWEEILVGTHTHDNKQFLDKLSKIDAEDNSGFIEVIRTDDGYDFNIRHLEKQVPSLPKYIENVIRDNSTLIEYPENSEFNHLDGTALYKIDEPTVCAQCSDLYEYFRTLGKKLYIARKDGVLSLSDTRTEISVRVDAYDISSDNRSEDFQKKSAYIFTGNTSFKNLNTLIFIDTDVVSPLEYSTKISDEHENILAVIFDHEVESGKTITLITLENNQNITVKNVYDAISENVLSLSSIKTKIFEIYVNASLWNKKEVPKVYLTNDENGNLVWENRLLPTQSFYCRHKYVEHEIDENAYLDIEFENVYFDSEYDFPIIMIDQLFAFDAEYFTVGTEQQNLKLKIPGYYFKEDGSERVTLVVIKNTMGNAISQEMLRNYVSKEDAIKILSHGSITLDDFVKYTDLDNYAFKAHTHSNFALLGHTHDYRYADYRHTHAEYVTSYKLLQVINQVINTVYPDKEITDANIREMSEDLILDINTLLAQQGFVTLSRINAMFEEVGFSKYTSNGYDGQYYLSSDAIYLNDEEISSELLEKLLYPGENAETLMDLNFTELVSRILNIFNRDTVEDSQVLLKNDIIVYNSIGGIKEFDKNGYRTVLKKGTDLSTILNDMLNPYISREDIEEMLVPVRAEFKFYSDEGCTMEISPDHADYEDEVITIYAKFIRYINKFGENCEYTYSIHENNHTVKMDINPNIPANITITPIDGDNGSPVDTQSCQRVSYDEDAPNKNDVVFAFTINPTIYTISVIEIWTQTSEILSIYDNRGNEVISKFSPIDVASGDYFFNFEKCLAEYTILDGNETILQKQEFNSDIMVTIPANNSETRTLIIAYQKYLSDKISVMSGQDSILSAFTEFEPNIQSGEVNSEEYTFIKYEFLPLDYSIEISICLDKSNITCKPVYGQCKCDTECGTIDNSEIAQIYSKLQLVEDFIKGGPIRIVDIELDNIDSYIKGYSIYPEGYIFLNKELPKNGTVICSLEYGGQYNSNFTIERKDADDRFLFNDKNNKKIGFAYSFKLNRIATALTDNSTLTVFVSDGISNDNNSLNIRFKSRIMHGIYGDNATGLNLTSINTYAGTYNYDFYIQTGDAGQGSYIILAIPSNVLTENVRVKFEVNSFEGGFEPIDPDNAPSEFGSYLDSGWTIYKSVNDNLGQVLVHVYTIGNDQDDPNTSYVFGKAI